MYESPFDMVMTPLSIAYEEVKKGIDGQIIESVLKATQAVNVTVDKEELLRALRYDRDQYDKGYADAKAEIIHCEDCEWWTKQECSPQGRCALSGMYPTGGWFCGNARMREVTT